MIFKLKTLQASADLDAMKANMDQFFLIVNGSIIILMQVYKRLFLSVLSVFVCFVFFV